MLMMYVRVATLWKSLNALKFKTPSGILQIFFKLLELNACEINRKRGAYLLKERPLSSRLTSFGKFRESGSPEPGFLKKDTKEEIMAK